MKQEKTNGEIIERFIKFTFYQMCDYILCLEERVSNLEEYNDMLINDNNLLLNQLDEYKGE